MHECFNRYGYYCVSDRASFWKDQQRILNTLKPSNVYPSHNGCINSIKWDSSGNFILSGGDDRSIALTDVFAHKIVLQKQLRAKSNIFTVSFLPQFCNDQVFAGFRCGCIIRAYIERLVNEEPGGHLFFSHKMPVYDIIPLPDFPYCFLSLSHDRTVRFWDSRLPHHLGRNSQLCGRSCFSADINAATSKSFSLSALAPALRFDFPVTAGDVHPVDGSRAIAIASSDGFVRLFDLRRLFSSENMGGVEEMDSTSIAPYQVVRPLGLASQSHFRREIRLDYGPLFITSVQFEPPPTAPSPFALSQSRLFRSFRSSSTGRHLLVSHMYSPVFLFDLNTKEDQSDVLDPATVVDSYADLEQSVHTEDPATDSSGPQEVSREPAEGFHPNVLMAMLLVGLMERRRAALMENHIEAEDPVVPVTSSPSSAPATITTSAADTEVPSAEDSSSGAETARSRPRPPNPGETFDEDASPFDFVSDETVKQVLSSIPRARQVASYPGQKSIRTVIKDSCFWGREYVLSGSECGNVLVWHRSDAQAVCAIKADEVVVNRLQPHPFLPYLAVSGVDRTIKLIEPSPIPEDEDDESRFERLEKRQNAAREIMQQNVTKMHETLRSGAALMHQFASFRIGRAARNFLRRLAERRVTEDDSEQNNSR
uniref:DDB1-and CUL4-associated factor 6 n=1 Tax=Schistocephalus solidus TaxID=70667 RepID=A0A0V0J445_SCHSO